MNVDDQAHRSAVGKYRAARRHHPDEPQLLEELRRDIRFQRLLIQVQDVVDTNPGLTPEQRAHIAGLLLTGGQ